MITSSTAETCLVYYALSTDTKPTDVGNGSILYEIDDSKLFIFDEKGKTWVEQSDNELEVFARGLVW